MSDKIHDVVIISTEGFYLSAGPLYVASLLIDHGYSVKTLQCLDKMFSWQIDNLVDKFIRSEKQIIGISATFTRVSSTKKAIKRFIRRAREKFPNIKIVVGGANNFPYDEYVPSDAFPILGQNRENDIIDTFNRLTGRIIRKPFDFKKHKIKWKQLFPNPVPGVIMFLEISRGCIFDCTFCNYNLRRSPSNFKSKEILIEEIEEFYSIFGTKEIAITCNTFNDDEEKIKMMHEVADSLSFTPSFFAFTRLDLLMRQSEIVQSFYHKYVKYVFFGVESFDPKTLKKIRKSTNVDRTKQYLIDFRKKARPDVNVTASMIVGLPEDSYDVMQSAVNWFNETEVADYLAIQPLRLNDPTSGKVGINEFSSLEINAHEYGYTIFPSGTKTLFDYEEEFKKYNIPVSELENWPPWIRSDGYHSAQAIVDAVRLNNQISNTFAWQIQMLLNARGHDFSSYRYPRQILSFIPSKNSEPNLVEQEVYGIAHQFVTEYFNILMSQ